MERARTAVFIQQHSGRQEQIVLARSGTVGGARQTVVDVVNADSPARAIAATHVLVKKPSTTGVAFAATPGGLFIGHGTSAVGEGTFASASVVEHGSARTLNQFDHSPWNSGMISYSLERRKVLVLGFAFAFAPNATSRRVHLERQVRSEEPPPGHIGG